MGISFVLYVVCGFIFGLIFGIAALFHFMELGSAELAASVLTFASAYLYLAWKLKTFNLFSHFGKFTFSWKDLVTVSLVYITSEVLMTFLTTVLPHPYSPAGALLAQLSGTDKNILLGVAILLAPATEEFMFRGVLLSFLSRFMGTIPAVMASSAIFAAMHHTASGFIFLFIAGVALAIVRVKTKNLFPGMIMHCANNALAMLSP